MDEQTTSPACVWVTEKAVCEWEDGRVGDMGSTSDNKLLLLAGKAKLFLDGKKGAGNDSSVVAKQETADGQHCDQQVKEPGRRAVLRGGILVVLGNLGFVGVAVLKAGAQANVAVLSVGVLWQIERLVGCT